MLSQTLPAMLAACQCERKFEVMKQKPDACDGALDEAQLGAESDFLEAFSAVVKETASFASAQGLDEQGQGISNSLQKFQQISLARVASQMDGSIKEVATLTQNLQDDLIDLKPILKDLNEHMSELLNFPTQPRPANCEPQDPQRRAGWRSQAL